MGANNSTDIKYISAHVNGKRVSIPYIRLPDGQWVPLQQNWALQQQQWNIQRTHPSISYINQNMPLSNGYPLYNRSEYFVPNPAYYNGIFFQ